MAVFLSPGVFPTETDLSVLPTGVGPLRPGFVGAAKKGPMNVPVLITNAAQYVDTFGEPFQESYLGYAVMGYLEEGDSCYVMRVGIECEDGQADALANVCVDTSGARGSGWGRIPLFTGIDYGRINLREVGDGNGDNPQPFIFHAAAIENIEFNDAAEDVTDGATTATADVTGTYTGAIDDTFVLIITAAPSTSEGSEVDGAEFQVIRNSDGEVVAEGVLSDGDQNGTSQVISVGDGVSVQVVVTDGRLDVNDTFTWSVRPNNRVFEISVDGESANSYTMPATTYDTVEEFVDAANDLLVASPADPYLFIAYTLADGETVVPQIRSRVAGNRVQIVGSEAWALEVGSELYAWDIPRSYLIGNEVGPYDITTQNNRIKVNVIGSVDTQTVEFNIATGLAQNADAIASIVDASGVVASDELFESFVLTIPSGTEHLVIMASDDHMTDTLELVANYSNLKTLRFAEEFDIPYPYRRAYRGYSDNRATLPDSGETDPATPLSCEDDSSSDDCAADTAYFANIVGWLVAPSPGTWVDDYSVTLSLFSNGLGDSSGRYKLTIKNSDGQVVDAVDDVSFDKREERYIGNVINAGSTIGGAVGNAYVQWEERPAYLENDITDLTTFEVRLPSQFNEREYLGTANGIPDDPAYSSELDAAVIGNPSTSTGLYAFQNPESIDINLLLTPGFSTGAVIGTALQICEARGDVLYLVDPPFGLRPQQAVDWHNGMLISDLSTAINSSYGAMYWGWLRIFDQFNSSEMWVPPSGHVAAIFSRTARETEQWQAPAGLRRGRMLTALDVEYSPTQGERDLLYGSGNAVNALVKFPQDGIVVWGQRTLQRSQTALDRVNVRMLLIYLKKNLVRLLRNFIFEPNDRILWRQVLATCEPFIADVQARRGLTAFRVICDETNNTPERVDRNELWVTVLIKPTKAVEFVALNVVALRTGASFSAEEVLAAGGIVQAQTAT